MVAQWLLGLNMSSDFQRYACILRIMLEKIENTTKHVYERYITRYKTKKYSEYGIKGKISMGVQLDRVAV